MSDLGSNLDWLAHQTLIVTGTYWLHSTLLLGVAWLLSCTLSWRRPAVADRLWKFAAVAPLVTSPLAVCIGISIPGVDLSSIVELRAIESTSSSDLHPDLAASGQWKVSTSINARRDVVKKSSALSPSSAAAKKNDDHFDAMAIPVEPAASRSTRWPFLDCLPHCLSWKFADIAGVTVGIVILGGVCRVVFRFVRLCHWLRHCQPIDGRHQVTLDVLRERWRIRKLIVLSTSSSQSEPIACGWLRWQIVVPTGCADRLTCEEWTALLSHELAHLARGDTWWSLIGALLCNCLPFQPLNFLARRKWITAAEILCDDWAVSRTTDPFSLASCLTRIAEWKLDAAVSRSGLAPAATGSTLTQRVERLLRSESLIQTAGSRHPWRLRMAAGLLLVGLACFSPLTPAKTSSPTVPPVVPTLPVYGRSGETKDHQHTSQIPSSAAAAELAELEMELTHCAELAAKLGDEESRLVAVFLNERARLLSDLIKE